MTHRCTTYEESGRLSRNSRMATSSRAGDLLPRLPEVVRAGGRAVWRSVGRPIGQSVGHSVGRSSVGPEKIWKRLRQTLGRVEPWRSQRCLASRTDGQALHRPRRANPRVCLAL